MNCEISLTWKLIFPLYSNLNHSIQHNRQNYYIQWTIYYTHLNNSNICKINYRLRTSDVTSCFMTSSVTTRYTSQLSALVAAFSYRWKKQALAILLIYYFMDSSESNITPRLRTVWAQWMDEEATVREHCSWEILARCWIYRTKQWIPFLMGWAAGKVKNKVSSNHWHELTGWIRQQEHQWRNKGHKIVCHQQIGGTECGAKIDIGSGFSVCDEFDWTQTGTLWEHRKWGGEEV